MRSLPLVSLIILLAACSGGSRSQNQIDLAAAANTAQADVDNYAAGAGTPAPSQAPTPVAAAPTPEPSSLPPVEPIEPGKPGGLPDDGTPVSEAPFTPDSAQGAANVLQTYFALLGEKKYAQAWALWDRGGQASGMSAAAFAADLAKYRQYDAQVGAPGRIDAGAGQRYVEVPVQVYGRLGDGTPFHRYGTMTLHRAGDIDGATAAQKTWHISAAALKPVSAGQ